MIDYVVRTSAYVARFWALRIQISERQKKKIENLMPIEIYNLQLLNRYPWKHLWHPTHNRTRVLIGYTWWYSIHTRVDVIRLRIDPVGMIRRTHWYESALYLFVEILFFIRLAHCNNHLLNFWWINIILL